MLAVDMTGDAVKAKNGSMVAYTGQIAFKNCPVAVTACVAWSPAG